jgi:hypothetical protein
VTDPPASEADGLGAMLAPATPTRPTHVAVIVAQPSNMGRRTNVNAPSPPRGSFTQMLLMLE